jgi:hypothetical protein
MECMAIGGPNGNNPLANLFKNNATSGVAPKNQTEQVSSTGTDTSSDTAKSAERIAELRAKATDGFSGTVDFNTLARTAGASPIASSATKFNETSGITATSALGEPSSVTAIDGPVGAFATNGNPEIAFGNQQLLLAAKMSQAGGISGDFQVATANAELEKDHRLLASVG